MIGIVYGDQSGIIRRIIVPDYEGQLDIMPLDKGEVILKIVVSDIYEATKAVEAFRGKPSEDPRCVIVDKNGDVIKVILADPLIDVSPDGTIVKSPDAVPGWTTVQGVLTAPAVAIA